MEEAGLDEICGRGDGHKLRELILFRTQVFLCCVTVTFLKSFYKLACKNLAALRCAARSLHIFHQCMRASSGVNATVVSEIYCPVSAAAIRAASRQDGQNKSPASWPPPPRLVCSKG